MLDVIHITFHLYNTGYKNRNEIHGLISANAALTFVMNGNA